MKRRQREYSDCKPLIFNYSKTCGIPTLKSHSNLKQLSSLPANKI